MSCKQLQDAFPEKTFLPSSSTYTAAKTSYFAAFANEVSPACLFQPSTASDVAEALKLLQTEPLRWAKIAVRGGGYTPWAGAANVQDGVVIDMRKITGVSLNEDTGVVSIGAGEMWSNVYKALEPSGLTVAGGRVSKVGVAGLITGGGLSYFSGKKGFVCDSVLNFEVVLASGKILNANSKENSDLFVALKGGSNNFGIVTRFDLSTFAQGGMWGGAVYYHEPAVPALLREFVQYATNPSPDADTALIVADVWQGSLAIELGVSILYDAQGRTGPACLKPFVDIPHQLQNTLRSDSHLGFADEQSLFSDNGAREPFFVTGYKPDLKFITEVRKLWQDAVKTIVDVPGLKFSCVFQPLTVSILAKSAEKGPNALGLAKDDAPLVVNLFNTVHLNAEDDSKVVDCVLGLVAQIDELAVERGTASRYKFMNYGFDGQRILEGYGEESVKQLQAVSEKYDPTGFFQERVPGGFKISRVQLYTMARIAK